MKSRASRSCGELPFCESTTTEHTAAAEPRRHCLFSLRAKPGLVSRAVMWFSVSTTGWPPHQQTHHMHLYDAAAYEQKHHIAAEVGDIFGVSGRQVRRWAREFLAPGSFRLDRRGLESPQHLLDEEDVLARVRRFLFEKAAREGRNGLTVDKFHRFVNRELLPSLAEDTEPGGVAQLLEQILAKNDDGTYTISRTAAHNWMTRAGAERAWHKQGTYTDVHEKPEVHAARVVYPVLCAALQLREKTWVHLPKKEYEDMVDAHNEKAVKTNFALITEIVVSRCFFCRENLVFFSSAVVFIRVLRFSQRVSGNDASGTCSGRRHLKVLRRWLRQNIRPSPCSSPRSARPSPPKKLGSDESALKSAETGDEIRL